MRPNKPIPKPGSRPPVMKPGINQGPRPPVLRPGAPRPGSAPLKPFPNRAAAAEGKVSEARIAKEKASKKFKQKWDDGTFKVRATNNDVEKIEKRNRQLNDRSKTLGRLNAQSARLAALKMKQGK